MKRMLRSGWFASLALAASPALGQGVRPVGHFQPVVNLARPAPLTGSVPADRGTDLEFKSVVVGQPTPLVRGKIEIEAAKPLPQGTPTAPTFDIIRPAPVQPPIGYPVLNQKEFVPPQPKVIQPLPKGPGPADPIVIYPQGTYPQGTFPQGTYPQGTYPQGTIVQPGEHSGIVMDPAAGGVDCDCVPGESSGGIFGGGSRGFGQRRQRSSVAPWTSDIVGDACGCTMEPACGDCMACEGCLPRPNRFWVRGEYLLWSFTQGNIPALVTTNTAGRQGALGDPATRILFNELDNPLRSGAQFTLGMWLPNYEDWGIEGGFFFIGQRDSTFFANSGGTPVLSMPYFDVGLAGGPNVQSAETEAIVGPPGGVSVAGSVNITYYTAMSGFEFNLRRKLTCGPQYWLDGLIGYRHLNVDDSIVMSRNFTVTPNAPAVGPQANFDIFDSFRASNTFNGGQIGLDGEYKLMDRLSLRGTFKLALGNMYQAVDIDGASTQTIAGGAPNRQTGGVYALTTNIGHHTRNTFTVIPEFGLKLNYDVTDNVRLYAGYSALYMPDVLRAGQQIDNVVNSNFIPFVRDNAKVGAAKNTGPQRPAVLFNHTGMWAHGVNFGVEYHY